MATEPTHELIEIDDDMAFLVPVGLSDETKANIRAHLLADPEVLAAMKQLSPYVIHPGKDGGNPRIVRR